MSSTPSLPFRPIAELLDAPRVSRPTVPFKPRSRLLTAAVTVGILAAVMALFVEVWVL